MRLLIPALLALGLTGCASMIEDNGSSPGPIMRGNLTQAIGDRFAGRPVSEMLARYGAPVRQMALNGETIYSWNATEKTYYQTQPPLDSSCQLDAYVTSEQIVRTIGLSGQNACLPKFQP